MQDYIDYELNKFYKTEEEADRMAELGFDNYEDYADYMADLEADYQERQYEAMKLNEF